MAETLRKTAFIYNTGEEMRYFILEGDYRHLNGIYINSVEDDEAKQEELVLLVYDSSNGHYLVEFVPLDVFASEIRHGADLIECGCLP